MVRKRNRRNVRQHTRHISERLVAELVVNYHRRYALYYLHEQSGPVALEDVARQVAAWERDTTPREVTATEVEAVRSSLRRIHLPYLAERTAVTYHPDRDQVTCRVDDPMLELLLANDPRTSVRWYRVYLALTATSAVLLALVRLDVPGFSKLGSVATVTVIVGLFAAVSVAHWYDVYRWRRRSDGGPPDFLLTLENDLSGQCERDECFETGDESDRRDD